MHKNYIQNTKTNHIFAQSFEGRAKCTQLLSDLVTVFEKNVQCIMPSVGGLGIVICFRTSLSYGHDSAPVSQLYTKIILN